MDRRSQGNDWNRPVRQRHRFAIALLSGSLLLPGCSLGAEPTENASPLEVQLGIRNENGESVRVFQAGDDITLELSVRNTGDEPYVLSLRSAQTHSFVVTSSAGEVVWNSSQGRFYAQMLTELKLAPGETRIFSSTWNQVCAGGRKASSEEYRASGSLATHPPSPAASSLAFTIR